MERSRYERLNTTVMGILYSPLLLIIAWVESREAHTIKRNQQCGRSDDDTTEEWEQMQDDFDPEAGGWGKQVLDTKPNVETDAAVLEVRALKKEVAKLMEVLEGLRAATIS